MAGESGLVVVDKPAGWTSHQVVGRIRRLAGTRKVGHAGTLDPMATGVLLVGVNRATRLLGHLMLTSKTYTGTIRLGIGTVTDDAEGEIVSTPGATGVDRAAIAEQVAALTGDIAQVPTKVSAIKVDGVRSYARVRSGEDVELAARPVHVARFDVTAVREERAEDVPVLDLDVSVECSAGTYVRALARDLGAALGSAGHLTMLRRTGVGPYGLDRAVLVDPESAGPDPDLRLIDLDTVARENFPAVQVDPDAATAVRHGRRVPELELSGMTAVFDDRDRFLALYRPAGVDSATSGAVAEAVFRPA